MQYAITASKGLDLRITNAGSEVHALNVIDDFVCAGFEVQRVSQDGGDEVELTELLRRAIELSGIEFLRRA